MLYMVEGKAGKDDSSVVRMCKSFRMLDAAHLALLDGVPRTLDLQPRRFVSDSTCERVRVHVQERWKPPAGFAEKLVKRACDQVRRATPLCSHYITQNLRIALLASVSHA